MKLTLLLTTVMLTLASVSNAQTSGNSLHFDGSDDYVDCSLPAVFNNISSNDFTIEMWVKQESSQFCRLFFAQLDANNFTAISLNGTNEIVFYLSENSTNHSIQSSDAIVNGEWTHIAASWNATTMEPKIYINGTEVVYASGLFVSSTGLDAKLTIGSRTDGNQNFNGEVDEVSIWGNVKTECEIIKEQTSKLAGDEAGLVRYYGFDSGTAGGINTGLTTLDAGPFAAITENGTLMNFSLIGGASNWLSSGVVINKNYGEGGQVTLTGQTLAGEQVFSDFFAWINCSTNTQIPGATSATFNPTLDDPNYNGTPTSYAMISSDGTCLDTTECFLYDFTGIGEFDQVELSIYPNPTNGVLYIESTIGLENIQVVSANGRLIKTIDPQGNGAEQIDLSDLNGIYFLKMKTAQSVIVKKVSVE